MQGIINFNPWAVYFEGLAVIAILAVATWLLSLRLRDVSIVDSAWSIMFVAAVLVYLLAANDFGLKNVIILALVLVWALRLSIHLTWRNWGEPEDHRYVEIRKKYSPNFPFKSLFIIFLFQAVLAWIISLPLLGAITLRFEQTLITTTLLTFGIMLWIIGMFFETVADYQLARFKNNPSNHRKVMDKGLWKYSRHPNYFGECVIWWGFYLIALSMGAWWSIISPLILTWLLLKFSGVVMLEETITKRRPEYEDYVKRTNAFIPGPVKHQVKLREEHA